MSARPGSSEKEPAPEGKKADEKPAAEAKKAEEKPPAAETGKAEAKAAGKQPAQEAQKAEEKPAPEAPKAPKAEEKQPPAQADANEKQPAAEPKADAKPPPAESKDSAKEPISEGQKSDPKPAAEAPKADPKPSAEAPKADTRVTPDSKGETTVPVGGNKESLAEIRVAKPAAGPSPGAVRTLGINLSAAAKFTTLIAIEWSDQKAWVSEAIVDLEDDELIGYLSTGDRTGVYAPFGWPVAMVEAVASYTNSDQWQRASRREFRHRETEAFVHDVLQSEADQDLWPQSVSCDRLALQARRMAQLREQLFSETGKRFDRAGGDHVLEVYTPGASLLWGLNSHSASGLEIPPDASEKPGLMLIQRIEAAAPWLQWKEGKRAVCLKNEHTGDALLAALVARAAELDLTIHPENGHLDHARREGWMHLPTKASLPSLATAS